MARLKAYGVMRIRRTLKTRDYGAMASCDTAHGVMITKCMAHGVIVAHGAYVIAGVRGVMS
jgi:hypothetical protein